MLERSERFNIIIMKIVKIEKYEMKVAYIDLGKWEGSKRFNNIIIIPYL